MKHLITLLLCCSVFTGSAQYIGGLYAGKLTNDSTKKEQQYELALSEYRGQITGYAYTTFIVRDTFYYSVKRVKAKREAGMLLVEDVKMLANNFPQAPDKGVKQQMRIPLDGGDSLIHLNGSWKTTQTKNYYSIGGGLQLKRENDSSQSALVRHLYELDEWQRPTQAFLAATPNSKTSASKTIIADYTQRKEKLFGNIAAGADSLVLSFFDNGVVDGDTISVYLNGSNIISKAKLTAAAARQVIHLDKNTEHYQLLLVAENLGTIPPNTGLLVILDGSKRYQVHFTADLQTNAVIRFRREQQHENGTP